MNKTIYKYVINPHGEPIKMPKGAEILTVQVQNNAACIWALVDPKAEPVVRNFDVFGTGHDVPCDMGIERKYIGTFQIEAGLVFHLFERIN